MPVRVPVPDLVTVSVRRKLSGVLWSRRKGASEPELMMALSREGDVLTGKLYVLAPEAGPGSSFVERVVGDWEAAPLATP